MTSHDISRTTARTDGSRKVSSLPDKKSSHKSGDVFDRICKKRPLISQQNDKKKFESPGRENKDHLKMGLNDLIQKDHDDRRKVVNDMFFSGSPNNQQRKHNDSQELEKRIVKADKKMGGRVIERRSFESNGATNSHLTKNQ